MISYKENDDNDQKNEIKHQEKASKLTSFDVKNSTKLLTVALSNGFDMTQLRISAKRRIPF